MVQAVGQPSAKKIYKYVQWIPFYHVQLNFLFLDD